MAIPEHRAEVRVRPRGARRIGARHPWVFSDDVASAEGVGHGDFVRVLDPAGKLLGLAMWSARSKIALRMVSSGDATLDASFWQGRIDAALARRGPEVLAWGAKRLLFGESDGVPGCIADLYGTHLVVQLATAGAARIAPTLIAALRARLPVDSVLERNDASVRALEGLPREVVQTSGATPAEIVVEEAGIRYAVDPWRGQKTGAFLDQRENRCAAEAWSRGRVLDGFSYHASFGLHAARRADEVIAVDGSSDALARGEANARRNGLSNMAFVEANAFEDLRARDRRGERFDLVMLDPPAFAKSRADVEAARRGYKEINLRALRLLTPGGILITSSCSYNLDEPAFEAILREAAADAGADATIVARRGQSADHPVLLGFPESRYLKCFVLRVGGGAA